MYGHLIHIGFPKCGSTFLQEWFLQHPYLRYSPGGLASIYNVYQISHLAASQDPHIFKYFVTSDESLSTPRVTTGTIPTDRATNADKLRPVEEAQVNSCNILKSLYPNAKILCITRGIKGSILSGYSQYVREGGVLTLSELTRISLLEMVKPTVEEEDGGGYNYTLIIEEYERAFGMENVLVLPFELLRDDQKRFLSLIEHWLNIPSGKITIGRKNESLSPKELYWYPRISCAVAKSKPYVGNRIYSRFYRWYQNKVFNNDLGLVVKLLTHFNPQNSFTEAEVLPEVLDYYRRNNKVRCALKFKENPLYHPYQADYLLDEVEGD